MNNHESSKNAKNKDYHHVIKVLKDYKSLQYIYDFMSGNVTHVVDMRRLNNIEIIPIEQCKLHTGTQSIWAIIGTLSEELHKQIGDGWFEPKVHLFKSIEDARSFVAKELEEILQIHIESNILNIDLLSACNKFNIAVSQDYIDFCINNKIDRLSDRVEIIDDSISNSIAKKMKLLTEIEELEALKSQ